MSQTGMRFAKSAVAPQAAAGERRTFELIRDTFRNGPFWNSTLRAVSAQIAAMSAPERSRLVESLAKTPGSRSGESLLSRWIGECTTSGIGPYAGLNDRERAHLWRSLLPGQDAAHLALVWQAAMTHNFTDHGTQRFREEFSHAVAAYGTASQRLGLERTLLGDASKDPQTARNVVELIGHARDTDEAKAAFAPLTRGALDHLVASSATVHQSIATDQFGGSTVRSKVDVSGFRSMAEAAAQLDNPRQKSGFIAASAKLFERLDKVDIDDATRTRAKGDMATGMSRVIVTDPEGIVENTLLQNPSRGGSSGRGALKGYVTALLSAGHGAAVGAITLALRSGHGMNADPMTYLSQRESRSGQSPSYPHAWVLGNWIGVVSSAVLSRISARDLSAGVASLMFTGGVDVMKELVGVALPPLKLPASFAAAVIKPSFNAVMLDWRTQLARSDRDFGRKMYELALPHFKSGVEATGDWVQTFNASFVASQQRQ